MEHPPRLESIQAVLSAFRRNLSGGAATPNRAGWPGPFYAIPVRFLNILHDQIPDWFLAGEYDLEKRFAELCQEFRAVAVLQGRFVGHPLLARAPRRTYGDDWMSPPGWPESATRDRLNQVLGATDPLEAIRQRREAYLGWLLTSPAFMAERDDLRDCWQTTAGRLIGDDGFFVAKIRNIALGQPREEAAELSRMADEMEMHFGRWDLLGQTTWDLPQPTLGNFGAPAVFGRLAGVDDGPTLQLPRTLRLPEQFDLDLADRSAADDHLAEWRAIEDRQLPGHLNYVRLRGVLHLHYLRNVVLAGAYGDRFRRRVGRLDGVFAANFGDTTSVTDFTADDTLPRVNEETVRKLRGWIDRRLARRPRHQGPN
ncbi:MAG TPA: hypothetical protein VH120_16310 [Gemmataceae bacterium]|nr:hypothetical protein [Gemmataceae bacterium]